MIGLQTKVAVLAGTLAVAVLSQVAHTGDLNPPPGTIQSSMKSLDLVEPRIPVGPETTPGDATALYILTEPGSYYLTGNVQGQAGRNGIRILGNQIALDLNGFVMQGVDGSLCGIRGVEIGAQHGIRVENGAVNGWGESGVRIAFGYDSRYRAIVVTDSGMTGMDVGGGSVIGDCVSNNNGLYGYFVNGIVSMSDCQAEYNGASGYFLPGGSLNNCQAIANGEYGYEIIVGTVINCLAHGNSLDGFRLGGGSQGVALQNCTARFNLNHGFVSEGSVMFSNCIASGNIYDGIHGIIGNDHIVECSAVNNGDDGFQVTSDSTIMQSTASQNQYGIFVPNSVTGVRIDSCSCLSNIQDGFLIASTESLIIRNYAVGNASDFVVYSSQCRLGTIVTTTGQIANSNPWANFGDSAVTAASSVMRADLHMKHAEAELEHRNRAALPARTVRNPATLRSGSNPAAADRQPER